MKIEGTPFRCVEGELFGCSGCHFQTQLGFCLCNAVNYIIRAGKKSKETEIEALEKAAFYINREIQKLKEAK